MSADEVLAHGPAFAPPRPKDGQLDLRALTPARVALERSGVSIATRHALEFSLAHAKARDAVHADLGAASLLAALRQRGLRAVSVHSAAGDRAEYLRQPDLGRRLSETSKAQLIAIAAQRSRGPGQAAVSIILADGLSALATERHALSVVDALLPLLGAGDAASHSARWVLTPICVAEQARVALGDEIGEVLAANVTAMLVGERPGLSSPDSLGAYITWAPRRGRTDAERNCVSNIRQPLAGQAGLDYADAAAKIAWYMGEGMRLGLSGVEIREADGPERLK